MANAVSHHLYPITAGHPEACQEGAVAFQPWPRRIKGLESAWVFKRLRIEIIGQGGSRALFTACGP